MTDQSFDLKSLLRYSWDYFHVHADQRMSVFNFFVALAVLMTGGLVGTFHKDFGMPALGIVLGLGLGFVSFVFWKLDQRVKFLLKNVEASLAELEKHFPTAGSANEPHVTQLFSWESTVTRGLRSSRKKMVTRRTVQLCAELQSSLSILRTRRCFRGHPVIDFVDCFRRLRCRATGAGRV